MGDESETDRRGRHQKMAAVSEAQDKFMNGAPRFVPQHDT